MRLFTRLTIVQDGREIEAGPLAGSPGEAQAAAAPPCVKSDRPAALRLWAPEGNSLASLDFRPFVTVNGVQRSMAPPRNEGAFVELAVQRPGQELFAECLGVALIRIDVSLGAGIAADSSYCAAPVTVAVPAGGEWQEAERMLAYIGRHNPELIAVRPAELGAGTAWRAPQPRGDMIEEVAAQCRAILAAYELNYPYFKASPRFRLTARREVMPLSKIRDFTAASAAYIAQHPEEWEPTSLRTGVSYMGRRFLPARTVVDVPAKDIGIDENRLAVRFLKTVCGFLDRLLADEAAFAGAGAAAAAAAAPAGYVTLAGLTRAAFGAGRRAGELADLRSRLFAALVRYSSILPGPADPVTRLPPATRIFLSVAPYRQVYERMRDWFRAGFEAAELTPALTKALASSRLYEYYCQARLFASLERLGYRLARASCHAWSHPDFAGEAAGGENNTFAWEKDGSEVTVWAQPVICTPAFAPENGLGLYRSAAMSFDGRTGEYYTPDLVMKVASPSGARWIVIDAKFSAVNTILSQQMPALAWKYCFSIACANPGESVAGVLILCGKGRGEVKRIKQGPAAEDGREPFFTLAVLNESARGQASEELLAGIVGS
ncbi:MAG: hypothetical protein HUK26_07105 [Duodenibacillus sp.]|nr:hypothetical protein [Duodenibacillus sp.]